LISRHFYLILRPEKNQQQQSKIAPQIKNHQKKKQERNFAPASSPWRVATLGVIFVLPFCNTTALYTSCLLSISKTKTKKNWQIFVWPFFENYMVAPSLTKNTMMME